MHCIEQLFVAFAEQAKGEACPVLAARARFAGWINRHPSGMATTNVAGSRGGSGLQMTMGSLPQILPIKGGLRFSNSQMWTACSRTGAFRTGMLSCARLPALHFVILNYVSHSFYLYCVEISCPQISSPCALQMESQASQNGPH